MKNKLFWLILTGAVAALIAVFTLAQDSQPTQPQASITAEAVSPQDHILGDPNAAHTLIEYVDFQCPNCARVSPLIDQLATEYSGRLKIIYRHFPLGSIHPQAFAAARAAEAAGTQGKFFEMVKLLFDQQTDWSGHNDPQTIFKTYAQRLGLDPNRFIVDYSAQTTTDRINQDIASGNRLGVKGTPSFYLNGAPLEVSGSYEDFKRKIDELIN